MAFRFTDEEWTLLSRLPEPDLVDLATDLDICPPVIIDARALLESCIPKILSRAKLEGLPFSKYDQEALEALCPRQLEAIGRLQGIKNRVTPRAVLRAGQRVYRNYARNRPDNPVALMLPVLLDAVARAALAVHSP